MIMISDSIRFGSVRFDSVRLAIFNNSNYEKNLSLFQILNEKKRNRCMLAHLISLSLSLSNKKLHIYIQIVHAISKLTKENIGQDASSVAQQQQQQHNIRRIIQRIIIIISRANNRLAGRSVDPRRVDPSQPPSLFFSPLLSRSIIISIDRLID